MMLEKGGTMQSLCITHVQSPGADWLLIPSPDCGRPGKGVRGLLTRVKGKQSLVTQQPPLPQWVCEEESGHNASKAPAARLSCKEECSEWHR